MMKKHASPPSARRAPHWLAAAVGAWLLATVAPARADTAAAASSAAPDTPVTASADQAAGAPSIGGELRALGDHLAGIWRDGDPQVFVSGYAYHWRRDYTEQKIEQLNEHAWGFGYSHIVDRGPQRSEMLYALGFLDSHKSLQLNAGYAWQHYFGPREGVQAGLGVTALIFQRPDIARGWPMPGVLPVGSLRYGKATLMAVWVPKLSTGVNNGAVTFVFGAYRF